MMLTEAAKNLLVSSFTGFLFGGSIRVYGDDEKILVDVSLPEFGSPEGGKSILIEEVKSEVLSNGRPMRYEISGKNNTVLVMGSMDDGVVQLPSDLREGSIVTVKTGLLRLAYGR